RVSTFLSHGVTTFEAKSGYGLTVAEELRHLRLLRRIAKTSPATIYSTCLALHAIPKTEASARAWSQRCADELLPIVAKEGLAEAVDAFIENGYFTVDDCKPFLEKAKALGLDIRLHADEFSDAGAAACAAKVGALSADHLQFANPEGIRAMAHAGVVAMLLPGTSLYTGIPYTNGRAFAEASCPVGIATDFNPGSCPLDNLRLALTLGALHCKLTVAEAIAAVTWIPAKSLKMHHRKGALSRGMDADLVILPLKTCEEFVADLGRCKPTAVIANGHCIS
ncbi:MAG: amidohydrolase family protein, partial [Proteobacteria bacterium]|nr:amidohydrolase family protein [Pseudomonadota bacterium]